jgi:hypothetical protein
MRASAGTLDGAGWAINAPQAASAARLIVAHARTDLLNQFFDLIRFLERGRSSLLL